MTSLAELFEQLQSSEQGLTQKVAESRLAVVQRLRAGDLLPGDCRIMTARDLFANEAALTGKNFPAEKSTSLVDQPAALRERNNSLFLVFSDPPKPSVQQTLEQLQQLGVRPKNYHWRQPSCGKWDTSR